ncbi:restriction endonuclease subunit S [Sphingopyxis sp.]|uniref:restriction endonuclease subunit S n=1 Tax=Sphingopyxis sp. TaxID=1908224 RepID=UPI00260D74CB|nr:restriction endonuclease subunit S [Sphingopyxis sp.]MCW0198869.1 restriction endonuclease subunit S [Sphingopyxis sp.]
MSGRAATDRIIRGRAAISVNDPGHALPRGWARAVLTDVADLGTGHTPSRHHPEYWDGEIGWIGIRDAGAHHGKVINETAQHITPLGVENSAARMLPKDTVCLSRTASVGYVVKMGRPMTTSQDFVTWSCSEAIDPDYLLNALLAEGSDIRRFGEGSTHTTIYFPAVKAFNIDLPPPAEQRRIVAKLDALTARLARVRAELDRVPALAARLRLQTLEEQFRDSAGGETAKIGEICRVGTGSTPKRGEARYYDGGTIPWVTSGAVNHGLVTEPTEFITDAAIAETNCKIFPAGSLLVALYGEGKTRGMVATLGIEAATNQALAVLHTFDEARIKPDWVRMFLLARYEETRRAAAGGVQPNINLGIVKAISLPVPSLLEQTRALTQINANFARADRMEAEAARARGLVERLEAAILAKAFRGELVPQDPDDEPASVLLDRIHAERAAAPQPKRGRRAKTG